MEANGDSVVEDRRRKDVGDGGEDFKQVPKRFLIVNLETEIILSRHIHTDVDIESTFIEGQDTCVNDGGLTRLRYGAWGALLVGHC